MGVMRLCKTDYSHLMIALIWCLPNTACRWHPWTLLTCHLWQMQTCICPLVEFHQCGTWWRSSWAGYRVMDTAPSIHHIDVVAMDGGCLGLWWGANEVDGFPSHLWTNFLCLLWRWFCFRWHDVVDVTALVVVLVVDVVVVVVITIPALLYYVLWLT